MGADRDDRRIAHMVARYGIGPTDRSCGDCLQFQPDPSPTQRWKCVCVIAGIQWRKSDPACGAYQEKARS